MLTSLPYYGGKSPLARGSGPWVNSLLPAERKVLYCEPFFGMGGVLMGRPPSHVEIVNDLNDRIVNWWLVIRDKWEDFMAAYEYTPRARGIYEWAYDHLDDTSIGDIRRALALTVVLEQGLVHGDSTNRKAWAICYNPSVGSLPRRRPEMIRALSDRMRDVQIECRDAVDVISSAAHIEDAIIYCDPPYRTSGTQAYRLGDGVDTDALTDVLRACKGKVAISGYHGEWDHLGWRVEDFQTIRVTMHAGKNTTSPRKERLWMNYDSAQLSFL